MGPRHRCRRDHRREQWRSRARRARGDGRCSADPLARGEAEEFLRGKAINEANAKRAGEIALEGAKPLKDNSYKIRIAQDLIQRGLLASV